MDITLHVGPTPYRVILSDRSIYSAEGDELEGMALEDRRLIVISRIVEPERREEVVRHEFFHAWTFHVPRPVGDEQMAQLYSLVSRQFEHDMSSLGGPAALLSMTPRPIRLGKLAPVTDKLLPDERKLSDRTDRRTCGACDTEVMCGSIHNGEVIAHSATGKFRLERWMQCDCCGIVQVWQEIASEDGTPLGEFVSNPAPKILRGPEAAAWLAEKRGELLIV